LISSVIFYIFFFFQAEDGIRDFHVTGVQTCALPIYKVIRQFGEVVDIKSEPGIAFKIPFIQNTSTLPKRQMTYNVSEAEINTKDKKRIIIDNYAVWKIDDPKKMISNARTVLNAETRMEEFIYSVVRAELGQLNYDEIIN